MMLIFGILMIMILRQMLLRRLRIIQNQYIYVIEMMILLGKKLLLEAYTIEKELGIELVGDIKVKIEANLEEDPWDEIVEENTMDEINEDFIEESL